MTTDITPVTDAPPPNQDRTPPRRSGSWIAILVTLVGSIVILTAVGQAVLTGIASARGEERATYTAAVDGVTAVDIDVSSGALIMTFAEVDEAMLQVEATGWATSTDWTFEVDGGVLRVSDDNSWSSWWPSFGGSGTEAELVLPRSLEGRIDADLSISAGDLQVIGDLADVQITLSAGSVLFDGASTDLSTVVSAGDANIDTEGPETVDLQVSAGSITAVIGGDAPSSTTVDVSAGDATLWLPEADYAVTGEASAGDRTIDVRTDPASPNALHVEVSAGSATVTYAD